MRKINILRPDIPATAKKIIDSIVAEDNTEDFKSLEHYQMQSILSEICSDKYCYAYTSEYGLLQDCIADVLSGEYKANKSYQVIEEVFIETWLECIDAYFLESMAMQKSLSNRSEEEETWKRSYSNMNDGFTIECYSDKHGV